MNRKTPWTIAGAVIAGMALNACDNGQSAVETRDRAETPQGVSTPVAASAETIAAPAEKPRWTSNRNNTAEENIQRHFARNGADFGAQTPDAYVAHAHAFIANPPAGTETVRRNNGDTLYYQASSNTFLVANAQGVPRTLFKPDDGAGYWEAQKAREAARNAGG